MPCRRVSLSIGALLGNPKRVRLPGLLREKCIWVPFLDTEVIKIISLSEASASLRLIYIYIWVPSFWTQRILGK